MTDRMEECPPRMRLYMILNGVIPSMYRTPCKIAIFTDGQKLKVFEKVCLRAPDTAPQRWVRNYFLESKRTPWAVENLLWEHKLLKENDDE